MDRAYHELNDSEGDQDLLAQVSLLHSQVFRNGFSASLGIGFVQALYSSIVRSPDCFLIVALVDQRLAGYISATYDNRMFPTPQLRGLIRRRVLTRAFTGRLNYLRLFQVLRNRRLGRDTHGMGELLSLQVCQAYRRNGLGRALVQHMTERLSRREIGAYCVYTDDADGAKFYESLGIRPVFKTVLRGVRSACFVKHI